MRTKYRFLCALFSLVLLWAAAPPAASQPLGPDEAEELVRLVWFEGLPEADARQIGPAGAARLVAMLEDPDEAPHHANILVALGHCRQAGAFEAIDAWASTPRIGELDRATFRAWQALPYAYGYLAASDPRGVTRLAEQLNAAAPAWSFRHHHGARLRTLQRRGAASALAETGLPAARAHLQAGRTSSAEFEAHLHELRAVHAVRAGERTR